MLLNQLILKPLIEFWGIWKGLLEKGTLVKRHNRFQIQFILDVDCAWSAIDRRSTFDYCSFVGTNLVTWRNKKQNVVAKSSVELEFRAITHGICEGTLIKRILEELRISLKTLTRIYCNNEAAIYLDCHNPFLPDRTKHIEVDKHFIKEKIEA